ncbi:HAUS augmin-like complex subunit 6 N-terminus-domain-containing protein [Phaeosphaeriaceae sp. PMI808]|nr:HAUS augmin-like complex subunit 6 N-terminus-domain-containing protein [Phaeosphaeriaceae sp. PMI808]
MSRSTSQSSTATNNPTNGSSRSLPLKANTKTQLLNPIPVSDVKLFATTLRLLDLDLLDDWPDITVQTFSARNADQRQRISATEWALFRLFEIWDPKETAQKLRPFFPPLEPLQSLNLRAALFRALNELKKNDGLGRESVLRKTMLDECKGDKFYEVLSLFSNAVLKKVLAAQETSTRSAAVARKLGTAPTLSLEKQQSLLPLAIAHKTALINILKRKEDMRIKYLEFEALLDSKSDDINRRIRKTKDTPRAKRPAVPQKEADAIKKQLKDNWIGSQKWLDVMLHGDHVQAADAFLGSRFEKVWRVIESGRKLEDVTPENGLLEDLQSRVQGQQDRLQKWKLFHEHLQNDKVLPALTSSKAPGTAKDFMFNDHLKYQLPTAKRSETEHNPKQSIAKSSVYHNILTEMNAELVNVSNMKPERTVVSVSRRRMSSSAGRSPMRSRKNTRSNTIPTVPKSPIQATRPLHQRKGSSFEKAPVLLPPRRAPVTATPMDSEATLIGQTSILRSQVPSSSEVSRPIEQYQHGEPELSVNSSTSKSLQEAPSSPPTAEGSPQATRHSPSPERFSAYPSEPPTPFIQPPESNVEDVLAEQIITSIGDATPSPVKKPQPRMSMSLMERTRMSMARTTSFEPVPESPLPLPSPQLSEPPTIEVDADHPTTLLERTRLSMIAMQSKPRVSLSARERNDKRKSRHSLFPVNQFDTPRNRKSFELIEEVKSTDPQRTPKESLFSDEIDYDRVFKSRPRIATSPVFSPPQQEYEEEDYGDEDDEDDEDVDGVTGIDLGDVDQDEDEDGFTKTWADSPSRRVGKIRY